MDTKEGYLKQANIEARAAELEKKDRVKQLWQSLIDARHELLQDEAILLNIEKKFGIGGGGGDREHWKGASIRVERSREAVKRAQDEYDIAASDIDFDAIVANMMHI